MALPVKFLPMIDVAEMVHRAGFRGERAVTALAVIWAESGGNQVAVNINVANPESKAYLSLDLGICQWNTYWHPRFKFPRHFDPLDSIKYMFYKSDRGRSFSLWMAYTAGAHEKFLPYARQTFINLGHLDA
jgi:hypothetical protein